MVKYVKTFQTHIIICQVQWTVIPRGTYFNESAMRLLLKNFWAGSSGIFLQHQWHEPESGRGQVAMRLAIFSIQRTLPRSVRVMDEVVGAGRFGRDCGAALVCTSIWSSSLESSERERWIFQMIHCQVHHKQSQRQGQRERERERERRGRKSWPVKRAVDASLPAEFSMSLSLSAASWDELESERERERGGGGGTEES